MNIPEKIYLFDIDSVLVEPLGYRAALMETLRRFIHRIGFEESILPDIDTIEYFEAMHVTSEWDMAPIILAKLIDSLARIDPQLKLPPVISDFYAISQARDLEPIDYKITVLNLSEQLVSGEYPATTALKVAALLPSENGTRKPGLFPHIAGTNLLKNLLSNTRDPFRSITTRCFQHYSLGSQEFSRVYGIPPDFQTTSMLKTCDKALLEPALRDELLSRIRQGELGVAAITNRPSHPPREISDTLMGYAPEAEMALELNGLSQIPLIGFGRMRYIAEQYGLETEDLLKPSPIHVMAAILAAITANEVGSIEAALQLSETSEVNKVPGSTTELLRSLRNKSTELIIHIFEDTRWGIEGAFRAGNLLKTAGIPNKIHAWGIASNPQKVKSLEQLGAVVHSNVSEAVRTAITNV